MHPRKALLQSRSCHSPEIKSCSIGPRLMVYLVSVRWGMAVAELQSTVPQRVEVGPEN